MRSMLFRQLFDRETSTYTYLLADETSREAIIIDPVLEQLERDVKLIGELRLSLTHALDTHVHADHVSALGSLKERLGARTVISERAGVGYADLLVKEGDVIRFGGHGVEVFETPGHTSGCITYVTIDRAMAFTGDALLIRGCGRTDFQGGSSEQLWESLHDKLFVLPGETLVYPGHDYLGRTVTTIEEERQWNPRLGGNRTRAEFVEIMANLHLAYPAKIDIALPRNLRCGSEVVTAEPPPTASWAPIEVSAGGIPEVAPEWLAAHTSEVRIIDVREPAEYTGELGHIEHAELMPLGSLPAPLLEEARDRAIVTVCRSGGRSGKAAMSLAQLGFTRVASMRGGMTAWNQRRFPVTR